MRVLVVHPEDRPILGPWTGRQWSVVYDLGRSGWAACERWSAAFQCPVRPIDAFSQDYSEVRRTRELLHFGFNHLVDKEGLDWWELTSILVHHQLERLVLLWKLIDELPPEAEIWITRDCFEARTLRTRIGTRLQLFTKPERNPAKRFGHYFQRLTQLPFQQIAQTLGDKYDTSYRIRRHFQRAARGSDSPVVLLPTSYINMSRTGVSCAQLLPQSEFLMVATRRSGRLAKTPANVRQEWLASYAGDSGGSEYREMLRRWSGLKKKFEQVPELAAAEEAGLFSDFPKWFADGIAIRNAWVRVLEKERVSAVLCSDDSNPHTHIPMLLAKRRGLPALACHHGALDGRYMLKRVHADVVLAKGRMERDYLVRNCGVDPERIEIGTFRRAKPLRETDPRRGNLIVYFSEPYEMTGGRTEEIYRDILPRLSEVSRRTGKRVVIKLHPSENLRERQSIARRVLNQEQTVRISWLAGSFGSELMEKTWFGLTVLSSVVVQCAEQGVPCFLCDWLDVWPYGYVSHFKKFGVGLGLQRPEEIENIPDLLAGYTVNARVVKDCCEPMDKERLRELLHDRGAHATVMAKLEDAR